MQRPPQRDRPSSLHRLPASVAMASLVALMASSGCRQREADPSEATPARPTASAENGGRGSARVGSVSLFGDTFAAHTATSIEVSRLSRVNRTSARGRPSIDLRLDAFDAEGAPARLAGDLRVVVVAPGSEPETLVFEFPLRTVVDAARRYDATLEQYLVRVEPEWETPPAIGSSLDLSVRLMPPAGAPLEAVGRIEW